MMQQTSRLSLAVSIGLFVACGNDGFSYDDPRYIQPGDAVGDEFEGLYDVSEYWTDCTGDCDYFNSNSEFVNACDQLLFEMSERAWRMKQVNGALEFDELDGGVNSDGSFAVSGTLYSNYDTKEFNLVEGTFGDGDFNAVWKIHVEALGGIQNANLDCELTADAYGDRRYD